MTKKSLCVFCGASNAAPHDYIEEGQVFGKMIAEHNINLVFGAGDCGMMGAIANATLKHGGKVTGVYPEILKDIEEEHHTLTELITVPDMHTRKMTMFDHSDAFAILPGGFGTMDETFEVITWKQLHTHEKPIVLYNYKNYWKHWEKLTEQFIELGFASQETRDLYTIVDTLDAIFDNI